ncbi:hypothetical protein E2C01_021619 [Portunus trituberculatus]|uniref:Uncharacterized protein n=1 Tax=Portunus trituberculatus TaxID=210409 RepID=A0A5B7E4V2_PORTR|nr:hypothetical protein [Portunus trituberculatus]
MYFNKKQTTTAWFSYPSMSWLKPQHITKLTLQRLLHHTKQHTQDTPLITIHISTPHPLNGPHLKGAPQLSAHHKHLGCTSEKHCCHHHTTQQTGAPSIAQHQFTHKLYFNITVGTQATFLDLPS